MEEEKTKGKFVSFQELSLIAQAYQMIEAVSVNGLENVKRMGMAMENIQTAFNNINEREIMEIDNPQPDKGGNK